jgi:hypothetical protein
VEIWPWDARVRRGTLPGRGADAGRVIPAERGRASLVGAEGDVATGYAAFGVDPSGRDELIAIAPDAGHPPPTRDEGSPPRTSRGPH